MHEVAAGALAAGIPLFRLLAESGLCASLSAARRLIREGGARVNGEPASDEARVVTESDLRDGAVKLSAGRKQHRLVRPHACGNSAPGGGAVRTSSGRAAIASYQCASLLRPPRHLLSG